MNMCLNMLWILAVYFLTGSRFIILRIRQLHPNLYLYFIVWLYDNFHQANPKSFEILKFN